MTIVRRFFILTCLLISIASAPHARAELRSQHVAILANAKSPESLAVARHYAVQRNIPPDHIIPLYLPFRDSLTRSEYEDLVVTPLRHELEARKLSSSVRVIVTTYGIPLRVEAPQLSSEERRLLADAQSLVKTNRTRLEQLKARFGDVMPGFPIEPDTPPFPTQDLFETSRTAALLSQVDRAWRAALEQLRQQNGPESERLTQELVRLTRQYGGWDILLQKQAASKQSTGSDTPQAAAWRTLLERSSSFMERACSSADHR